MCIPTTNLICPHDVIDDGCIDGLRSHQQQSITKAKVPRTLEISIITLNSNGIHGKTTDHKPDQIAELLNKKKGPTVLLLQENHSTKNDDFIINGVQFLLSGAEPDNRERGGVGIVLSKEANRAWMRAGQPQPIRPGKVVGNTRNIGLELHFVDKKGKTCKYFVISTYLPCTLYSDDQYELVLEQLEEVLKKCPKDATPVIGIDANAEIGITDGTEDSRYNISGPYGNPRTNTRGRIFTDFLRKHKLCSPATWFEKPHHHTYVNYRGQGRTIDYLLIPRKELRRFVDTKSFTRIDSDHIGIEGNLRIADRLRKRTQRRHNQPTDDDSNNTQPTREKPIKIDWESLRLEDEKKATFHELLEEELESRSLFSLETWDFESACPYDEYAAAIKSAAERASPSDGKEKRPSWFKLSKSVIEAAIQNRDQATKSYLTNPSQENRAKLTQARIVKKQVIIKARNEWLKRKIDEYESMNQDSRNAWKALREIEAGFNGHHKKMTIIKMRKADGTLARNEEESAKVFRKHFEENVFNRNEQSSYDPTVLDEIDQVPINNHLGTTPTDKEIRQALSKMQYEKSPGRNGIPTEAFKILSGRGKNCFYQLIQEFWNKPAFNPEEWHQIVLSILPKSGDLSNPNKWRGIALGDIASKCISSILAKRLTDHLKAFGIDEQCAMPTKGCRDATSTLKLALQTLREHNTEAYVLFVDLVKAYDTVNRELLWQVLAKLGIPNQTIQVLQKLYTDVTIHMKVGPKEEQFGSTCGVKQGDNLGPILFIYLIQAVSLALDKKWTFKTPEFRWQPPTATGKPRGTLRGIGSKNKGKRFTFFKSYYVDDAAFLLLTKEDLIKASKLIVPHFRRFGLTVHTGFKSKGEGSKTEAMYIPKPQQESTTENTAAYDIDDDRFITFCDTFKYLGSTFTPDLVDTHDIETRIKQASKAFYAMNARVFRNTKIDIKLRMRTYEALIVNLVLWGCESWAIKECDKKKLEVFHNRCLRRILNLTMYQIKEHRIKNKEIRRRAANSYKMEQMMELRRCRWLKSISNMEDKRTPRKIIAAWTQQPRLKGGQQQTVRHGYAATLETLGFTGNVKLEEWMTLARDGERWAARVEWKLELAPGSYKPKREHVVVL
jgi:hypothetical protein